MLSSDRHAASPQEGQAEKATPRVGVIMLDTQFPRIKGDIGNPESFLVPPLMETAFNVHVSDIVRIERVASSSAQRLTGAAKTLEARGADIVTTSCGFLHGVQSQLASAVGVPLVASSLSLTVQLARRGHAIGLLTADASALAPALEGIAVPFIVEGLETSQAFHKAILADGDSLDCGAIQNDTVNAALRAKARGATCILLECTNLPPYRDAIETASYLPVFDIFDAVESAAAARVRA
ncbi:MAG: aspartate/glutamate racemase family protein [Pseudomonadota bacterium]